MEVGGGVHGYRISMFTKLGSLFTWKYERKDFKREKQIFKQGCRSLVSAIFHQGHPLLRYTIMIIIAIISIALYLTDKGEHTVLYRINNNVDTHIHGHTEGM